MDRIGEYLVRRLIGEGGMGKVYEAEERLSKRRVALKVLRPELTRHEDGRRLFLNEMQILAHLEHPNLVRSLASPWRSRWRTSKSHPSFTAISSPRT